MSRNAVPAIMAWRMRRRSRASGLSAVPGPTRAVARSPAFSRVMRLPARMMMAPKASQMRPARTKNWGSMRGDGEVVVIRLGLDGRVPFGPVVRSVTGVS